MAGRPRSSFLLNGEGQPLPQQTSSPGSAWLELGGGPTMGWIVWPTRGLFLYISTALPAWSVLVVILSFSYTVSISVYVFNLVNILIFTLYGL